MRQVVIHRTGGPEVLDLIETDEPVAGPGEVVVNAVAIGVGWPDILIRKGIYKWMPPLPASPGSELAGTIGTVGSGVEGFQKGDPVLVSARELPTRGGCYTESIAVPASSLFRLPHSIPLEHAASLGNFQVAMALLQQIAPKHAGTVFITGAAGGVGSAAVQLARLFGMTVIASISTQQKEQFARRQGANHIVNYRTENVVERVLNFTNGQGADLILDHIGGPALSQHFEMLATWGTIVSFNAKNGSPSRNLFDDLRLHAGKSPGFRCFSMHSYDDAPSPRRALMERVIEFLEAKKIVPQIAATLTLDDAAKAQELVESGKALGRVLLRP